jgi:hypothetical protein
MGFDFLFMQIWTLENNLTSNLATIMHQTLLLHSKWQGYKCGNAQLFVQVSFSKLKVQAWWPKFDHMCEWILTTNTCLGYGVASIH